MSKDLVRVHCRMDDCYYKKKSPHICLHDSITIVKRVLVDAKGNTYIVGVCTTYVSEEEMAKIKEGTKKEDEKNG